MSEQRLQCAFSTEEYWKFGLFVYLYVLLKRWRVGTFEYWSMRCFSLSEWTTVAKRNCIPFRSSCIYWSVLTEGNCICYTVMYGINAFLQSAIMYYWHVADLCAACWWSGNILTVFRPFSICRVHDDATKWKHFRVTGHLCAQRPVTRSFHVFFDLRLNKLLSKQSWGWWFETQSHPLWRHCNEFKLSASNRPSSMQFDIDGFVKERRDTTANALGWRLSCTNPSTCCQYRSTWGACCLQSVQRTGTIFLFVMLCIYISFFNCGTTLFIKRFSHDLCIHIFCSWKANAI